jgi:hypothetical protein
MTSVIRYADVINATGAVLTPTTGLVIEGKDGSLKSFTRVLAAIDVGTEAGKTRDATDPTGGCLVCTVKGAKIKKVKVFQMFRTAAATNQNFNYFQLATAAHFFKYGWRISADGYSLYLHDAGSDATTFLVAGDFFEVELILGNY